MQEFTQLGIAGATLLILFIVVRYFIQAIDKKDSYITAITKQFSETINTHLVNEGEARKKEMEALTQVTGVLDQHTEVLGEIVKYNMTIAEGMNKLHKETSRIKYGRRREDKPLIDQN